MNQFATDLAAALQSPGEKTLSGLYHTVSTCAMREIAAAWERPRTERRAAYLSMEFLMGRLLYANLDNLGALDELKRLFAQHGLDPAMFEDVEDAALGNGGLGRLAACFLDSAATHDLPLDGYGIRYKYGLFKQSFREGFQCEEADDWTSFGDPWSVRKESERVKIEFADESVWAVPYDMPVIGYGGKTVNTLRLWQAEAVDEFDFAAFNEQRYGDAFKSRSMAEAISSVLYPNDDGEDGRKLRVRQQYFFSSASIQSMLRDFKAGGGDVSHFAESHAIQLNDTHPVVAIPELLRLLVEQENIPFEQAFPIVRDTFCYTNHTIMAEALEKWDSKLFCAVIPHVYPYVVMIANRLRHELAEKNIDEEIRPLYAIVDDNRTIHMARMAVYATRSTNGVAAIHTGLLKTDVLKEWYTLYPERFSNKTNGITPRRWLKLCNPELAEFVTDRVGPGWVTNLSELEKLRPYADDDVSLAQFIDIKRRNKQRFAEHLFQAGIGPRLDPDSLFDIQAKRLHEYKRQLLNAFSILDIYFALKDGTLKDFYPTTFLFAAKSAPGYRRAKAIIKYINEIAKLVNGDPATRDVLRVLFVPNYNVSCAELLIPAADVSEQISTAGTEASGTGNMKFMLNGAVTLGTYDGANIEIVEQAGDENNYIFGARVEDIRAVADSYNPRQIYRENPRIRRVLDTLRDGTLSDGGTGVFQELLDALLEGASWHKPDHYYLLLDFESYVDAKLKTNHCYRDKSAFARQCLLNTAAAGKFSSDRTIRQYADEIWKIGVREL